MRQLVIPLSSVGLGESMNSSGQKQQHRRKSKPCRRKPERIKHLSQQSGKQIYQQLKRSNPTAKSVYSLVKESDEKLRQQALRKLFILQNSMSSTGWMTMQKITPYFSHSITFTQAARIYRSWQVQFRENLKQVPRQRTQLIPIPATPLRSNRIITKPTT